jgi:imidazolonepropionase-like amidohydrolase
MGCRRPCAAALLTALTATALAGPVTREDQVLILGNPAGSQRLSAEHDGTVHAEFSYEDRGRGERLHASWKLDSHGVPDEYTADGNDYMQAPVSETFRVQSGRASWQNRAEAGETALDGEAFYLPANAPPELLGVLARALLDAPQHRLPLLPAGEAAIEPAPTTAASGPAGLTQYLISGLDFSPVAVWLDAHRQSAAIITHGRATLAPVSREVLPVLLAAQGEARNAWAARLARQETQIPAGALLIRHARLFDPRDLSVRPQMSVLIQGAHIVRVERDADLAPPSGAQVLDAHGRFLMPGLWDNHQHFGDDTGALDIANGVTSARDMANDTDEFLERVARFDAGSELGPRVWKAGVIDGTGPYAAPTRMRIDNAAQAISDVDWYAQHGYGQIKIYSSVPPAMVPVIADAAHALGLRVSGHVPAFMSARQFVAAGADEIQHLNFIFLDFLFDQVKETRNMNRFTAVAAHAREWDPGRPQVRALIAYLRSRHTVLDPTVNLFEGLFCGDPARVVPGLEALAPRLPTQVRRELRSGALPVPKGEEAAYREALPAMLRLLKALYDAGITLIPGTDSTPGYALHRELELYVQAGIPAAQVLRMATLTSAQVVGASDRGVIAPGKLADLILVDGDPSVHVADLDNVDVVMKGGKLYDAARIERALGIAPRHAT